MLSPSSPTVETSYSTADQPPKAECPEDAFPFPAPRPTLEICKVVELFLKLYEFVIREHDELIAPILFQKLRVKFQRLHVKPSIIGIATVENTINADSAAVYIEEHPPISDSQSAAWREMSQLLHVTGKIIGKLLDSRIYTLGVPLGQVNRFTATGFVEAAEGVGTLAIVIEVQRV